MKFPVWMGQLLICFIAIGLFAGTSHAAVFKGVQSGAFAHITINGTKTETVTLSTAIDPAKAYLMFQSSHNSSDPPGSMIRGRILDANTLEFVSVYDKASTINIQWYVVEYSTGVRVQRGVLSQSSTTMNVTLPLTLAAVNQAFVTWSKTSLGSHSDWSVDDPVVGQITSSSNLQFRVNEASSGHIIWWQVVEYTDAADISVQTFITSMTGNAKNKTLNITAVDHTKSFILASYRTSGSGGDINERMISAKFKGVAGDQVEIKREEFGDDLTEVVIQIIELNDGTFVQGGESKIKKNDKSKTEVLSAVNISDSIAFASVQAVGGQNMGRVKEKDADIIGEGSVRLFLSSSTQLTLIRDSDREDARIGWFVLDFSGGVPAPPPSQCSATFVDGLTSSSTNGQIKFEDDSQLLGNPDTVLATSQVDNDSSATTCQSADCTAAGSGSVVPALTGSYVGFSSGSNLTVDWVTTTISANDYKDVTVTNGGTLNMSSGFSTYHFKTLNVKKNSTVNMTPGDYYLEELEIEDASALNVTGTGTVRIYVRDKAKFKDNSVINGGASGDPSKFFLYFFAADDNKVKVEDDASVAGFIYSEEDVEVKNDGSVFGGISAADDIKLKDNAIVTYDGSALSSTDFGSACSPDSSGIDHYEISHSSPGVTCEGSLVTVTAHDASHNSVNVGSDTSLMITTNPAVSSIVSSPATILSGTSSTTFHLNQTSVLSGIDIDVTDGSATDPDDGGAEDLPIDFLDTAFRFYANGSNIDAIPIGTQISGKASSLTPGNQTLALRAVRTSTDTGACIAALAGVQAVDIAYECNNPTTCSASNQLSFMATQTLNVARNNNGAALSYTPVNMTFDGSGIAPFSFNFSDAGKVTLHARKSVAAISPDPAFTLTGSSNVFVTRPFGFDLDFANARAADWLDGGTLDGSAGDTTYAANSSGSAYLKSGSDFPMQITAVTWESGDDSNNDGVPDGGANLSNNNVTPNFGQETAANVLSIAHTLNQPVGGVAGTLSSTAVTAGGSFLGSFSGGVAMSTLSWDEVGIVDISASLQDYLVDTSADIFGSAPNVGRFYPDHFLVTANNGTFANACSSFSYIGQSFIYGTVPSLSIVAQNLAGGTTQNYTQAGYQKLVAGNITRAFPSQDDTQLGKDSLTNMTVTPTVNSGTLASGGSAGALVYNFNASDSYLYDKNTNAEIGPFASALSIATTAVQDSDGAAASSLPSATPTGTAIRYGRLNMENVFGPETEILALDINAQYLDSTGAYVLNTADSCSGSGVVSTSPAGTAGAGVITGITVGSGTSDLSYNTTFSSGEGQYQFTAPGTGNTGVIDIDVDLSALPWLQYDWDGNGTIQNHPGSSATFGQYRGSDRIIYWREVVN